jgi:hypothetical protein
MVTLTLVLDFEDLREAMVRWMASQANRDIMLLSGMIVIAITILALPERMNLLTEKQLNTVREYHDPEGSIGGV